MNRRKFLGMATGATIVGIASQLPRLNSIRHPNSEFTELDQFGRLSDYQGTLFTETHFGELVEFERYADDFGLDNMVYRVRARFVNPKTNHKTTYALGWLQTREMREDGDDIFPHLGDLRVAMRNTIQIVKYNKGQRGRLVAPIKPEGFCVALKGVV